eukprot:349650-Chlamydomonas_euryale.AAC.4
MPATLSMPLPPSFPAVTCAPPPPCTPATPSMPWPSATKRSIPGPFFQSDCDPGEPGSPRHSLPYRS